MQYLKSPHLPEEKVKRIIIAKNCPAEIIHELESLDLSIIFSPENPMIVDATADHPDMNILHLGEERFICASYASETYSTYLFGAKLFVHKDDVRSPYPHDVALNAAIIDKNVFIYKNSTSEHPFEKDIYNKIYVNQGYTKCNIAIINKDAIITEDDGIYRAAIAYGIDALKLNTGSVTLNGYPYGFIGGATGKFDSCTLGLTGSLDYVSEKDVLKSFCRNHGVYVMELSNKKPCDIGSILPISYN